MVAILETFDRLCRDRAGDLALWSRAERLRLSFGELGQRVAAWERRLPAPAVDAAVAGAVAVAVGNVAAFPELFLALACRGVPMAALDAGLPAEAKLGLCRRLGFGWLLHRDAELVGSGQGGEALADGVHLLPVAGLERCAPPAGTLLVKLTSGSTGEPLGICLTAEALAAGIAQIAAGMEISAADRVLIAIPLSHSYGFDNGVLSLAVLGTPLVLEAGYYPATLLTALAQGEVSFFPAVPPMIRGLAESEWPRGLALRRVISAGGPLAPEFACRFRQRSNLAVHQFYGSTETGGISFEAAPEEPAAAGTVGKPLPGVDVALGADGTVTVDSPANFLAHLGRPPRPERRVALADRAEWTNEGRLRLNGRAADLLNVGGRRVSAAAVEAALRELPGVRDAAVVGVEDLVRGDRVVAFLVGSEPALVGRNLPQGLAARDLRYVEALPFTDRGKLDRCVLRRWAAEKP